MTQAEEDTLSHQTLDLLEARLDRLQYVLNGDNEAIQSTEAYSRSTIAARLRALERNLASLTSKSSTASQIIDLQRRHPSVFHPADSHGATDGLPPAALASLVLAHARSFELVHKQLYTVGNMTVPDPSTLVPLVELRSKIDLIEAKQQQLAVQTANLRSRSASLLESWYTDGVLDMSEHWADWEERLRDVEILVRRMEAVKRREDGFV